VGLGVGELRVTVSFAQFLTGKMKKVLNMVVIVVQ
jgi:hypothetical protein